jgi:precorrin-6A/cobalt-precorrin-6A reductase
MHQGGRLWIFAGTGDGPPLASALLARGWRLRISLVNATAALPYRQLRPLAGDPGLELQLGPLAGAQALQQQLLLAGRQGDPFAAVIDATHPFATQVSEHLQQGCGSLGMPLLRQARPPLPQAGATVLPNLQALAGLDLTGEVLLLALGSRQLAAAVALTPAAVHCARVLPRPQSLQLALAAGLPAERLACLQPSSSYGVEEALVRQWGVGTVLARQSGGLTEAGWRRIAERQGLRLLLLARPQAGNGSEGLTPEALLAVLDSLALPAPGQHP